MLVGYYGGTFDPVHLGHTHAALAVARALDLPEVRMVLAARPGHRGLPMSDTSARWAMLERACAGHAELVPDDMELQRAGESYTVTTLEAVREANPDALPCWILGQDAFATLPIWHRWQDLLEHCNLIVVDRPGDRRDEPPEVQALCERHECDTLQRDSLGQIVRLELAMLEISASDIRRRIAAGQPVEHLLAADVCTYIRRHRLYQSEEDPI